VTARLDQRTDADHVIHVTIMTPGETLFEGEVTAAVLPGDRGDFEVLRFHRPLIGLLRPGPIVLDGREAMRVRRGVVRVNRDRLVALVES